MEAYRALVEYLVSSGQLRTPLLIAAFRAIPRAGFVRPQERAVASADEPLPIGWGQTTSAPSMIAAMLELLKPAAGSAVLEVGTGLGWTTALLAHSVGPTGSVVSYELEPELAEQARANLLRAGIAAEVRTGDGTRAPERFDRILLKCACATIPAPLVRRLRIGGRLVAPVGGPFQQELTLLARTRRGTELSAHGACVFVPLRGYPMR